MYYRIFLLIGFVLGLSACQGYPTPETQSTICDPNYAHCPDETDQVVSTQIDHMMQ